MMTNAERLAEKCPKCHAIPGSPCVDPLGEPTSRPHKVRGPGQLDAHLVAEAQRKAERQKARYGPLFREIAEREVAVESLESIRERKRYEAARAAESRDIGIIRQCNRGLAWVRLWGVRWGMAEVIGEDRAKAIWENMLRVYGNNLPYIESALRRCLTTTVPRELGFELRFEESRKNANNADGRYLVCVDRWEPTSPVMTPAEYDERFPKLDHEFGYVDVDEPDDGGLFDRMMAAFAA